MAITKPPSSFNLDVLQALGHKIKPQSRLIIDGMFGIFYIQTLVVVLYQLSNYAVITSVENDLEIKGSLWVERASMQVRLCCHSGPHRTMCGIRSSATVQSVPSNAVIQNSLNHYFHTWYFNQTISAGRVCYLLRQSTRLRVLLAFGQDFLFNTHFRVINIAFYESHTFSK